MWDSRTEEKSCSDVQLSSQDPTAAKNLAVHALVSRVIASVINEGLALGVYNQLEHRGALLPLSSCPGDNQRSAIVTFPLGCHPLYALSFEGVSSDFLRILFIDPEDIPKRNPCDFQLVQPERRPIVHGHIDAAAGIVLDVDLGKVRHEIQIVYRLFMIFHELIGLGRAFMVVECHARRDHIEHHGAAM